MGYKTTLIFKIDKTYKDHDLEVVVGEDGHIYAAVTYSPILDEWLDCLSHIEGSALWRKRIAEELGSYDWEEHKKEEWNWGA